MFMEMIMILKTEIVQTGNNTGIEVGEKVLEQLGGGKKPLVVVTINGYSYRSAVGKMDGKFMISLSAENRKNAQVRGGDLVEVTIAIDTEPRIVAIPIDFQNELDANKTAKINFDQLAPSKKKAMILSITEAKTDETRNRRIQKSIEQLK